MDEGDSLVLFAHLIPLCQYHAYHGNYKEEFEEIIGERSKEYGNIHTFLSYLFSHPANQSVRYNTLLSSQVEDFDFSNSTFTWELLLTLMRNILCHEYNFEWKELRLLTAKAIEYFGSLDEVWEIMKIYHQVVVCNQVDADCQIETKRRKIEIATGWQQEIHAEIYSYILLFAQFIPSRANNSIVDDSFEDVMRDFALKIPFGSWDSFGTFLKTHPANKEQVGTGLEGISWIMVIRLMRNVFCHEQYFDFRNLREFYIQCEHYFKSIDNIQAMLDIYKSKCGTTLEKMELYGNEIVSAASIQLDQPHNHCIIHSNDLKSPRLFSGISALENFLWKEANFFRNADTRRKALFIMGTSHSGKSTIVKYVFPSLLGSSFRNFVYYSMDCQRGIVTYEEKISSMLRIMVSSTLNFIGINEMEKAIIESISEHGEISDTLVVLDSLHELLIGLPLVDQVRALQFIDRLSQEAHPKCSFAFTGSSFLPWIYFSLEEALGRRLKIPLISQSLLYEIAPQSQSEEIKDFERLLRHYRAADKHELRTIIANLRHANVGLLSSLFETCQQSKDVPSTVESFLSKLFDSLNETLNSLSHEAVLLINRYAFGEKIPLRGKFSSSTIEKQGNCWFIRDKFLRAVAVLRNFHTEPISQYKPPDLRYSDILDLSALVAASTARYSVDEERFQAETKKIIFRCNPKFDLVSFRKGIGDLLQLDHATEMQEFSTSDLQKLGVLARQATYDHKVLTTFVSFTRKFGLTIQVLHQMSVVFESLSL